VDDVKAPGTGKLHPETLAQEIVSVPDNVPAGAAFLGDKT